MPKKGYRKPTAKKRSKRQRAYQGTAKQRKRRSSRNKARRKVVKKRGKKAVKGKDVHHKDRNPMNNSSKNLKISKKRKNRGNNK